MIPKVLGEVTRNACQDADEVCFEISNGNFCSIASVGNRGYHLKLHIVLFYDEGFKNSRHFIVHDVFSWNNVNNVELLHERFERSQHLHIFSALHVIH